MHDYDKVKLGLFDRYKVWRARKEAEDYAEGLSSENDRVGVDYSKANKLAEELLEKKK